MSKEKRSLLKSIGKKPTNGQYRRGAIQLRSVPGQSDSNASRKQYKAGLKKYFQKIKKKKEIKPSYTETIRGKRQFGRIIRSTIFLVVLLLLGLFVDTEKLVGNLEAISFFSVTKITSSGCSLVSEDRLREVSEIIPFQTNLLSLDCAIVEKKLLNIPWIAQVEVKRNWPSTVEISVVENIPIALLHDPLSEKSQLHYLDRKGNPFLAVAPGSDIDFPVITGLLDIDDLQLRKKALGEVLIFLKRIGRNHPYLPAQSVSEIHLNQIGEMIVYLTEYPFPIFFGEGDTKKKYSRLIQVLKALYMKQKGRESISNIKYIQMDYLNNKVLVAESESG